MSFKDLQEYVEPWLDLPIKGKVYRIDSVSAETGLYCQRVVEVAVAARAALDSGRDIEGTDVSGLELDDAAEKDFNRRLLGEQYDAMIADAVPWEFVKIAAQTVFTWTIRDRAAAEEFWARGGRPEANRPAPQDRRPAKKKSGRPASLAG